LGHVTKKEKVPSIIEDTGTHLSQSSAQKKRGKTASASISKQEEETDYQEVGEKESLRRGIQRRVGGRGGLSVIEREKSKPAPGSTCLGGRGG